MTPDDSGYVIVGLAITLVGGLLGLLRYINAELTQERLWREEADRDMRGYVDAAIDELHVALEKVTADSQSRYTLIYQEFIKSQRDVAEKYATVDLVERSEGRVSIAADKLGARIELLISRVENLGVELARSNPKVRT